MGFRWKVGNVKKIRFWKDLWFGNCSLAIQFWGVYYIVNEQGKTLDEAWNGLNLKFTLRRIVYRVLMNQWDELVQIASSIQFSDDEDALIW
jgi:hypothetical protein